jgi:hypothetical protein
MVEVSSFVWGICIAKYLLLVESSNSTQLIGIARSIATWDVYVDYAGNTLWHDVFLDAEPSSPGMACLERAHRH